MKSNSVPSKASSHKEPESHLGSIFHDGSGDSISFCGKNESENRSCRSSSVPYSFPFDILNDSAASFHTELQENSASLESSNPRDEDNEDEENNVNAKPEHSSDALSHEKDPSRARRPPSKSKSSSSSKRSRIGAGEKSSRSPRRRAGPDSDKPKVSSGRSKTTSERRPRVSARNNSPMRRAYTTGTGETSRRPKRSPVSSRRAATLPEVETKASLAKPALRSIGDGSLSATSAHRRVRVNRDGRRTRGSSPKLGGEVPFRRSVTTSSEPSSKSAEERQRQQRRETLQRNAGTRGVSRQGGSRSLSPCSPNVGTGSQSTPTSLNGTRQRARSGSPASSSLEHRRNRAGWTSRGSERSVRQSQLSQSLHGTTVIEEKSKDQSQLSQSLHNTAVIEEKSKDFSKDLLRPFTMNEQLEDLGGIQAMEKLDIEAPDNRNSNTLVFGFAGVVKVAMDTTMTAAKACSTATDRLREGMHIPTIGNAPGEKLVSPYDSEEGAPSLGFTNKARAA